MKTIIRVGLLSVTALASAATLTTGFTSPSLAEKSGAATGAMMSPSKNIVENAVNSKDHTTLVAAVKAAGLVDTLSGNGPFTVFAPTNAAFEKLPEETVPTLLQPENKEKLTGILTYHVVAGKMSAEEIAAKSKANGGKLELATVAGGKITLSQDGAGWIITDENGGKAKITTADVFQSNGVIHVIDSVILPKS